MVTVLFYFVFNRSIQYICLVLNKTFVSCTLNNCIKKIVKTKIFSCIHG